MKEVFDEWEYLIDYPVTKLRTTAALLGTLLARRTLEGRTMILAGRTILLALSVRRCRLCLRLRPHDWGDCTMLGRDDIQGPPTWLLSACTRACRCWWTCRPAGGLPRRAIAPQVLQPHRVCFLFLLLPPLGVGSVHQQRQRRTLPRAPCAKHPPRAGSCCRTSARARRTPPAAPSCGSTLPSSRCAACCPACRGSPPSATASCSCAGALARSRRCWTPSCRRAACFDFCGGHATLLRHVRCFVIS